MTKIIIAGSRGFTDSNSEGLRIPAVAPNYVQGLNYFLVSDIIEGFANSAEIDLNESIIVQGEANGVDLHAKNYAIQNEIDFENHPADWKTHGHKAGFIRNKKMLESIIDAPRPVLFAILSMHHDNKGTRNMIEQALATGVVEVWVGSNWPY